MLFGPPVEPSNELTPNGFDDEEFDIDDEFVVFEPPRPLDNVSDR